MANRHEEAIVVRNLRKTYPNPRSLFEVLRFSPNREPRTLALDDVSTTIYSGEIFGLLGPNGAGKSTLLKILVNLIHPDSGEVLVEGKDAKKNALWVRARIGFVPSNERSFFWRLSGFENLKFFASLYGLSARRSRPTIEALLEKFSIADISHRRFGVYSSGQKKLFTIVRSLLHSPSILVLDEPTNSLDPPAAQRVMDYVREELVEVEGRSVIWATHRLEEVRDLCCRVMLIDNGTTKFCGPSESFAQQTTGREKQGTLQAVFESMVDE